MIALEDRIALVTGSTAGIGAAVAERLVEAGARVVGCGRPREALRDLERRLNVGGETRFTGHEIDVTADGAVEALVAIVRQRYGREPDVVVVNAGRGLAGSLVDADDRPWPAILDLNCVAAARQMRAAARCLIDSGRLHSRPGDIVVIGSVAGRHVSPFNPVYGATKSALHALTEGLRREVARTGLRVTLVEPGIVRTEFQETAGYDMAAFDEYEQEIGPFLAADDVARLVTFVVAQPQHVHASDLVIRPTRQTYP